MELRKKKKMEKRITIKEIERRQEELDLEKERLGIETGFTEEGKWIMQMIAERDKKVRVGLGTMVMGRLLFGKFSK